MSKTTFVELNAVDRELIKQALDHWTNVVCDESFGGDFAVLAAEDLASRIEQDSKERLYEMFGDLLNPDVARANARVVNGHHRSAAPSTQ